MASPAPRASFKEAASYVGLDGSLASAMAVKSRFSKKAAIILHGLYKQATEGPCELTRPKGPPRPSIFELLLFYSWRSLGDMSSIDAEELFVKSLKEVDRCWYEKTHGSTVKPITEAGMHIAELESGIPNVICIPESKSVLMENGSIMETQDKAVKMLGLGSVSIYDHWIIPTVYGQRPKPRYQHASATIQDKMYIFGGNYNGCYLNDLQVLDFSSMTWSEVESTSSTRQEELLTSVPVAPCAGHSLVVWANRIFSIGGHTKDLSASITVKEFDTHTCTWCNLKTYGTQPSLRVAQSATVFGATVVIFGGEDANRSPLNDLHILDLETMAWVDFDDIGISPSPRSHHTAACHVNRYLLIFGGKSHSTFLNDLHILDLHAREWSRPKQQGVIPDPRAGHAGVTIGEYWFIVGGNDNKNGFFETLVLNMSTLVWSVVTDVKGPMPLASEGMSLVSSIFEGEDFLVSFGGYNGSFCNEVYVLKPSYKFDAHSKVLERIQSDNINPRLPTVDACRNVEPESEAKYDEWIRGVWDFGTDSDYSYGDSSEEVEGFIRPEKELEAASDSEVDTMVLEQELEVDSNALEQELEEDERRNPKLANPTLIPQLTKTTDLDSATVPIVKGIPERNLSNVKECMMETQDKVTRIGGLASVSIYDHWVTPSVYGQCPMPRCQHGSTTVGEKMYIFGGIGNGRYLKDLQVLDFSSLTWSKVEGGVSTVPVGPCAGHSMITWENRVLSIAGHTINHCDTFTVREFNTQKGTWCIVNTYGKPPVSRGGQSVTLVRDTLVLFGGEDAKRSPLNDLHILVLTCMTWLAVDTIGVPPSPRSKHVAAVHKNRYLFIFGGISHTTVFNDLYILDIQNWEWSSPKPQGEIPCRRAGHAAVTIGDKWFIVGGGNNFNGVYETLILNMSMLTWSVITHIKEDTPLASEGLSLVSVMYNGEYFLVSFGGYNGFFNNKIHVLKPSCAQSKTLERLGSDNIAPFMSMTSAKKDVESVSDGRTRIFSDTDSELSELQSMHSQLAAGNSESFKDEIDVAELAQKLQKLQSRKYITE